MSLKYEPASEPMHISAKLLSLDQLSYVDGGAGNDLRWRRGALVLASGRRFRLSLHTRMKHMKNDFAFKLVFYASKLVFNADDGFKGSLHVQTVEGGATCGSAGRSSSLPNEGVVCRV